MRRLIAWFGRIALVAGLTALICLAVLLGYGYAIIRPAPVAAYERPASARDVGPALGRTGGSTPPPRPRPSRRWMTAWRACAS